MIIVVMGVCGSGKSAVGRALSEKAGCHFMDADDYHSNSNRDKMAKKIPLTDTDRYPWLHELHTILQTVWQQRESGEEKCRIDCVLACSALKREYRNILRSGKTTFPPGECTETNTSSYALPLLFVYLRGTYEQIRTRMAGRTDHYMPVDLLDSQLACIEEPSADEDHIKVDISQDIHTIVCQIHNDVDVFNL